MRFLSKISMAFILASSLVQSVVARERGSVYDFELIRSVSPWLSSVNAAGFVTLPVDRMAVAEGVFEKNDGALTDNSGSRDSYRAGAATESFIRISDRLVFHGGISYSYFRGKDMGGPVFMNPAYNPVNFYESQDTTSGVKNKEMYHLTGGISWSLNDRWSVGAEIMYESGDQTKLKDPRFMNVWMDLRLDAGARYMVSDRLSLGLNLEYERTVETLTGKIFGTTDKKYYNFIDYGGFYGRRELFESTDGMLPTGGNRPMFNTFYGASLQVEAGGKTKVFNDLSYRRRSGYYGSPGSSSIMFTEHGGNEISYNGTVVISKGHDIHKIGLDLGYEGLVNNENIYRLNTQVGENTVVEYISQNEVLDRTSLSAAVSYTGYLGIEEYLAGWEYGVKASVSSVSSLTVIYPFYRESEIAAMQLSLFGKKNFRKGSNVFTVRADGEMAAGSGNPKTDGTYAASTSEPPRSFDLWLYRDFEYRTAPRIGAGLSFSYTRLFSDKVSGYIRLSDGYTCLLEEPEYLTDRNRNRLILTIGCTF